MKFLIVEDKRDLNQLLTDFFVNASDLINIMVIKREIIGNGFGYITIDYSEMQVVRVGV